MTADRLHQSFQSHNFHSETGATAHCSGRPVAASQAALQVDGLGGAEAVRAEEMDQFGIVPVDVGVDFLDAEFAQMVDEFIEQLFADP
jgi:hypothetical protein